MGTEAFLEEFREVVDVFVSDQFRDFRDASAVISEVMKRFLHSQADRQLDRRGAEVFLELSNTDYKVIMTYDTAGSNNWNDSGTGVDDVFGVACFPVAANRFGILILEDADGSCTETNPVINKGDKVILCIDTTQSFNATGGINERTDIWGMVCPEQGSPGVIAFVTPASYFDNIFDLQ